MSFNSQSGKKIIVIDAGHGGVDNGVVVDGVYEKDVVLDIAKLIKTLNKNKNIEIILLRDNDETLSLEERVKRINSFKPNMVISLHMNMKPKSDASGTEIYVYKEGEYYKDSKMFAESLLESIPKNLKKGNVKDANFFILKNSECPAVLVELGYMSNKNDREYLTRVDGQEELTVALLEVVNTL